MSVQYTAALIGLGNIAWRFDASNAGPIARTHLGAFQRNERVKVICGYSPVARDRNEFEQATGIPACSTLEELWGAKPDIVSICSPSETHYEHALTGLTQHVPLVWLEKPPTLTLHDLDLLIHQQDLQHGRTRVLVNYMRRYSLVYKALGDVYRQHILGKPLGMQILYSRGLETNGSHFLDVAFSMAGDTGVPEVHVSDVERTKDEPTFLLRFPDGLVASFCGHSAGYHINDVILTCADGRASVLSGGLETRLERRVPNDEFAGFFRLRQVQDDLLASGSDDAFSAALTDLIGAHEHGIQPRSNLTTARQTQAVIDQIRNT